VNTVRVKFGPNPYSQRFACAVCRSAFDQGDLLEGAIDMTRHNPSHPVGLA